MGRGRGRPSKYTKVAAERILQRLAEGRSLRSICADPDVAVAPSTVCGWVLDHDGFAERYARATSLRAEIRFEELLEIADQMPDKTFEVVNALRAKADLLKWALSKMKPQSFSDKLHLEHEGEQTVKVIVEYADTPPQA